MGEMRRALLAGEQEERQRYWATAQAEGAAQQRGRDATGVQVARMRAYLHPGRHELTRVDPPDDAQGSPKY